MSDKKETTTPAVKENVVAMAAIIEKEITLDSKSGQATSSDNVYEKTLPEDLTLDVAKRVGDHNATFVAAGAYAFGNMSVKAMAKTKSLESTGVTLKMAGKDSVDYTVDRTRSYRNPQDESAPIVKHGVISATLNTHVGSNTGSLKAARKAVEAAAADALKK